MYIAKIARARASTGAAGWSRQASQPTVRQTGTTTTRPPGQVTPADLVKAGDRRPKVDHDQDKRAQDGVHDDQPAERDEPGSK